MPLSPVTLRRSKWGVTTHRSLQLLEVVASTPIESLLRFDTSLSRMVVVPTDWNPSDVMTKALGADKFIRSRDKMMNTSGRLVEEGEDWRCTGDEPLGPADVAPAAPRN